MFILGNCRLRACRKFKFISFVIVLLLFFVEFVNTLICCFIWYCILLVLLILPQDPNNRSSAAQTIEDGVCASPRIPLWEKVPEGSQCIIMKYVGNIMTSYHTKTYVGQGQCCRPITIVITVGL